MRCDVYITQPIYEEMIEETVAKDIDIWKVSKVALSNVLVLF